jgi:hypothetical protein
MSTDTSQELSFSGMSLGEGINDAQQKAGLGLTSMFGAPTPAAQASTAFSNHFHIWRWLVQPFSRGWRLRKVCTQTDRRCSPMRPAVEGTETLTGLWPGGICCTRFWSIWVRSVGWSSGFNKTGLGTPMSTTPIVTPISTTSPSTFGGGGPFSAFASGGSATLSGSKPAETKPGAPSMRWRWRVRFLCVWWTVCV